MSANSYSPLVHMHSRCTYSLLHLYALKSRPNFDFAY